MAPGKPARIASLISKIHPPLPLNPRESQKLTKALSQSFQEHLDREHPAVKAGARGHSDAHISSILANPHFGTSRKSQPSRQARPRSASTGTGKATLEQLQSFLVEQEFTSNIRAFKQQVAAGEATLESAKACLQSCKRYGSAQQTSASRRDVHEASSYVVAENPGHVVANWLWSTGLEETGEFVHDTQFTRLLVEFLYAEGRGQRVRSWINKINARIRQEKAANSSDQDLVRVAAALNLSFIQTVQGASGINEALTAFKTLHENSILSENDPKVLSDSVKYLADVCERSSAQGLSVDLGLFDAFSQLLSTYLSGPTLRYRLAMMKLKHPESPNPDLAVAFLEGLDFARFTNGADRKKDGLLRFCLEVTKVLVTQGRRDEAERVVTLMNKALPSGVSSSKEAQALPHDFVAARDLAFGRVGVA